MTAPGLHGLRPSFEEDNPLLDFLLGLHALARTAPEPPEVPAPQPRAAPPDDADFTSVVLGLLSLSSRLERLVAAESRPPEPSRPAVASPFPSTLRDLLR